MKAIRLSMLRIVSVIGRDNRQFNLLGSLGEDRVTVYSFWGWYVAVDVDDVLVDALLE